MKIANEYSKTIDTKKLTDEAVSEITTICNDIGPRKPGSKEELKAQEHMAEYIKSSCNKTEIESFTLHRQGFMGFIPFTVVCGVSSVFLNWFVSSIAALIVCIAGIIPLVFEFIMYREFDDFLFPKQTSHNMIATRSPKGEVKKRIIMVGHSDSQFEWTINALIGKYSDKGGLLAKLIVQIPAVIGLIIQTIFALVCIIVSNGSHASVIESAKWFFILFFVISIVFIPFEVAFIFFQSWTKSGPGASDNLSGCYTGLCAMKALAEAGIEFENTEVRMICSGSEEAGLRGAKAYSREHEKELKEIPTVVIALDTFRDIKDMAVYDRDLSGTLQHHWGAKYLIKDAAANCGMDLSFASIYIGGCDAAPFTQRKIPATGFAAMNPDPPVYYHTRYDTPDNLVPEAINIGIDIMVEAICKYDKEGLPQEPKKK